MASPIAFKHAYWRTPKVTQQIPALHRCEGPPIYIAGVWQPWTDLETGETVYTVTLVTTQANSLMAKIHNSKDRMPTILTDELTLEWMMEDLPEERFTEHAPFQFQSEQMEACQFKKISKGRRSNRAVCL